MIVATIVRPATAEEIRSASAPLKGSDLDPVKSIARIDKNAKFLLATVASAWTALTGVALLSNKLEGRSHWLFVPICLACLSLGLAAFAITPVNDEIRPAYPDDILRHYNLVIKRRGWPLILAGWLFAASFLAAAAYVVESNIRTPLAASISFNWQEGADGPVLDSSLTFEQVPRLALIRTSIMGTSAKSGLSVSLFDDQSRPDSEGKAKVAGKLEKIEKYSAFTLTTRVISRSGQLIYSDRLQAITPVTSPPDTPLKIVLHFDFNDSSVRPGEAAMLNEAASRLKQYSPAGVHVDGYCDVIGSSKYNLALSRDRADQVAQYLERQGIDASLIYPRGFGNTNFVAPNTSESERAMNRRVEITAMVQDIPQ